MGAGGTVLHWDGATWSTVTSGTTSTLYGVWGSGANDVWAVGAGGVVLHWNGSAGSVTTASPGLDLYAVWGNRPE